MIHLTCGPMFAGKTSELIRTADRFRLAHIGFVVVKPPIDTRFGAVAEVVSHDGTKTPSSSAPLNDFLRAAVVLVDEVQFFDQEALEAFLRDRPSDSRTYLFGLDLDANGAPWPTTMVAAAFADSVTKLTAVCDACGSNANRTQRMRPWSDAVSVSIGGAGDYAARCQDHWRPI